MSDPRVELLLALADDELVMGHRHSQWTGVAPHLEEDLAFSSIAQDELGHAVVWYELASELTGKDVDALAFGRQPDRYHNAVLVERPNHDWAYAIARQYLYDLADDVRLTALADSTWRAVAAATGALRREERYHLLHARTWLQRLAHAPGEARARISEGLTRALADAPGLFEALPGEDDLVDTGILPVPHAELRQRWRLTVTAELSDVGLQDVVVEASGTPGSGGRMGRHSPDFEEVWEEMTHLYRKHPGASW